eukprot:m.119226 g.119226  ORF g.119226 m.119226 type:complete len:274 (+) comp11012_c0_seq1:43-864(+)
MSGGIVQFVRASVKSCSAWQSRNRRLMYILYALVVGLSWILSSAFLRHREVILIERQNALDHRIETFRMVERQNLNMTLRIDRQLAAALTSVNKTVVMENNELRRVLLAQGEQLKSLRRRLKEVHGRLQAVEAARPGPNRRLRAPSATKVTASTSRRSEAGALDRHVNPGNVTRANTTSKSVKDNANSLDLPHGDDAVDTTPTVLLVATPDHATTDAVPSEEDRREGAATTRQPLLQPATNDIRVDRPTADVHATHTVPVSTQESHGDVDAIT